MVKLSLVEELLVLLERPGKDDLRLLAVGPKNRKYPLPACRNAQVEKPSLHRETRRVRQQANGKWVFKGLLNRLQRQGSIQVKWNTCPIEIHTLFNQFKLSDVITLYLPCEVIDVNTYRSGIISAVSALSSKKRDISQRGLRQSDSLSA